MKNKIISSVIIFALIIITQTGCGTKEEVEDTDFYLDTACTITLYNINEDTGKDLIKKSFEICDKYEKLLSKTVKDSDVDKINRAGGKAVKVDDDTLTLIKEGIKLSKLSKGAFDITVGRLTDLWDFKAKHPKVPAKSKIDAAVKTVDYRQIKISGNEVSLEDPTAKIDLGGIAKGFIADKITEMLRAEDVSQAIINLGGNVVAIGEKEENTPWNIGVERPYSDRTEVIGAVPAKDNVIVSSGIYERKFTVDGKEYHHILDPKTGYPVQSGIEEVTILGNLGDSMDCDGYSTVCLLLGIEKGKALIDKDESKEALFLDKNDNITKTGGMRFLQ